MTVFHVWTMFVSKIWMITKVLHHRPLRMRGWRAKSGDSSSENSVEDSREEMEIRKPEFRKAEIRKPGPEMERIYRKHSMPRCSHFDD